MFHTTNWDTKVKPLKGMKIVSHVDCRGMEQKLQIWKLFESKIKILIEWVVNVVLNLRRNEKKINICQIRLSCYDKKASRVKDRKPKK